MSKAAEVILFRHGVAEDAAVRGVCDADRCLTEEGRRRTYAAAQGLTRWLDEPVKILASPLARARETADILGDTLETVPVELNTLAPGGQPWDVLSQLSANHPEVTPVAVGHEPDLSACIAAAVGAEGAAGFEFKKAGACRLRLDNGHGGTLLWMLPPRVLRQLAMG